MGLRAVHFHYYWGLGPVWGHQLLIIKTAIQKSKKEKWSTILSLWNAKRNSHFRLLSQLCGTGNSNKVFMTWQNIHNQKTSINIRFTKLEKLLHKLPLFLNRHVVVYLYIYSPIRCFCYVLSECQKVRNSHILWEQNGGFH